MRAFGLLVLLLAPLLAPTDVVLELPEPAAGIAGAPVTVAGSVHLEGPLSVAGDSVRLTLTAPEGADCRVEPLVAQVPPGGGEAGLSLRCERPLPGLHPLDLRAEGARGNATWNATWPVARDTVDGVLHAAAPVGYTLPVRLEVAPAHLDEAPVNLTWAGTLVDTPLGFASGPEVWTARPGATLERELTAVHGPGTYRLEARLDGPWTEPAALAAEVTVPAPPPTDRFELNVTVAPGEPGVALTGDSVNGDGKRKRPDQALLTRLKAWNTTTVDVAVHRARGTELVLLEETTLPVDGSGRAEHAFQPGTLPAGLVLVEARAGDAAVARTAQFLDVAGDALVVGPVSLFGDGRALNATLTLEDANFGSTPLDPGPVWGLPDLSWRLFRGSRVEEGWTVALGPFSAGSEGTALLSRLAWPQGASWARIEPGRVDVPLSLVPPREVREGTVRLSLYDPDGRRVGGHTFAVEAPPRLALDAEEPVPGQPWTTTLSLEGAPTGTRVRLALLVDGQRVNETERSEEGPWTVTLPFPLRAGTTVRLEAWGHWPGRPAPALPDAHVERRVPSLPPTLTPHLSLDGHSTTAPLALHPAHAHRLEVLPGLVDPNGDPATLTTRLLGPDDEPLDWPTSAGETIVVEVPEAATPGRSILELHGRTADGEATERIALDVGALARLRVTGPRTVHLLPGASHEVALEAANAGSVHLSGLALLADLPAGLDAVVHHVGPPIPLGEVVPLPLAPGERAPLRLVLTAAPSARVAAEIPFTVLGVLP